MPQTFRHIAVLLYATLFYTVFLSGLSWLVGGTITLFHLPLSFLFGCLLFGKETGRHVREIASALVIIIVSIGLSALIYDYSADGQWYHMPAAYALSHGWNPVYESHNPIIADVHTANLWIDHYCKGIETMAATIVAVTGNVESGKAVNLIMLTATFLLLCDFLSSDFPLKSKRKILFYAFVLALSPIVACELFTFYIDWVTYYSVVWLFIILYRLNRKPNHKLLYLLFMTIFIGGSTKLNITFWMGYFVFFFLIFLWVKKKRTLMKQVFLTAMLSVVSMLFIACFNPFITNFKDHHNPIYPFGDKQLGAAVTSAIISGCQPRYIVNEPRVKQVFIGLTARPNGGYRSAYIPPYKITATNIMKSGAMTANVGGGGLFFVDILLLSIILLLLCRNHPARKPVLLTTVILFLAQFVLPYGSCYRYVPFVYLIPLLFMLYSELAGFRWRGARYIRRVLYVLVLLNITLDTAIATGFGIRHTYIIRTYVEKIRQQPKAATFKTTNWSFIHKVYGGNVEDTTITNPSKASRFVPIPHQKGDSIWVDATKITPLPSFKNPLLKKVMEL